jgi:hypothetical protein
VDKCLHLWSRLWYKVGGTFNLKQKQGENMKQSIALPRRASLLVAAIGLLAASAGPLLLQSKAHAAQLVNRKIAISSSVVSATNVTYSATFTPSSTTAPIKGIVVEICQNSPLIGVACTTTNGVTATPTSGTITVSQTGATPASVAFNVHANSTSTGRLILSHATGFTAVSAANPITFSFTATNPSGTSASPGTPGTFYGRVLTYTSDATAAAYTDTVPGTHLDEGGTAMSTANQLTTTARVQEQLQFCVGGTTVNDATTSITTDCATAFTGAGTCGNAVDLGVIDSSAIYSSPVSASTQGNTCNGAAMVRTNANSGVVISYYAEQAVTGTNHLGSLRVTGASCNAGNVSTDQCIDSVGGTQATLTAGVEKYGMTVGGINCGSTTAYTCTYAAGTYNMVRSANYDGTGADTYDTPGNVSNQYAWDESGTAATLASSSGVVDDEALVLRFAAGAGATTPTGTYSVKSTYIATATY